MLRCPSCGSRFFKTLELRFEVLKQKIQALLYKKRCKRCKHKYLIELTADNGQAKFRFAQPGQWQKAHRVDNSNSAWASRIKAPVVSHYTLLISSDTGHIFNKVLYGPSS